MASHSTIPHDKDGGRKAKGREHDYNSEVASGYSSRKKPRRPSSRAYVDKPNREADGSATGDCTDPDSDAASQEAESDPNESEKGESCEEEENNQDSEENDDGGECAGKDTKKVGHHRGQKSRPQTRHHDHHHHHHQHPLQKCDGPGQREQDLDQGPPKEWKPNSSYHEGDELTYNGAVYVCIEDHTSRPSWVPPNVVNLWEKDESGSIATTHGSGFGSDDGRILPYASELFGVYQPLVGWKSELSQETLSNAVNRRVQEAARYAQRLTQPIIPRLTIRALDRTGSQFGRALAAHIDKYEDASIHGLLGEKPDAQFAKVSKKIMAQSLRTPAAREQGEGPVFGPPATPDPNASNELAMSAVLRELEKTAPHVVSQLFRPAVDKLTRALGAAAFFAGNGPASEVYLSPIGILHQFRQYFFQLGTFIGPPVGHVWISLGGSVELVEVNTRRKLVEQTMEQMTTTVTKSETSTTDKDELSDAVKAENASDMKLGVSTTASGGIGAVCQASGTASFNLRTSRKQAQEQTHKKMREQSAKLTSEITQNYKTTFRTVTEVTDTSSQQYILQNTTPRLVSYELSQKIRKVGVQVQDLGQRLCFQLYVENPGDPLSVRRVRSFHGRGLRSESQTT